MNKSVNQPDVRGSRKTNRGVQIAAIILAVISIPFVLIAVVGLEDWLLRTNVTESVYRRLGILEPLQAFYDFLVNMLGR